MLRFYTMLFSPDRRYVFIANPKTATTSIEARLLELDARLMRNEVVLSDGSRRPLRKHATAQDVADVLGDEASNYTFVAFVRDPIATALSKYFYYRMGRGFRRSSNGRAPLGLRARVFFCALDSICRLGRPLSLQGVQHVRRGQERRAARP